MDIKKAEYYYKKFQEVKVDDYVMVACENANGSGHRPYVKRTGKITEIKFHSDFSSPSGSKARGQVSFVLESKGKEYCLSFTVENTWVNQEDVCRTFIGTGSYIIQKL